MKRHRFDPISFVIGAGLLALGIFVAAGSDASLLAPWLGPAVVIGLGVLLLVAGWQSSRGGDAPGERG